MFKHSLDDDGVSAQTDINKPEIPVAWTSDLRHSNTERHFNTEKLKWFYVDFNKI